MGDMAEYYDDREDPLGPDDIIPEMEARYAHATTAKVGAQIQCPTCGTHMTKRSYQHKFCKGKGRNRYKCKDRYWDTVDDTRRERAKMWS